MLTVKKAVLGTLPAMTLLAFLWSDSLSQTTHAEQTPVGQPVIQEQYQPGTGLPVGKIQSVRGEVVITHRETAVGYRAKTGLPIYQEDTIITRQNARILGRLIDGSQFVLAPATTLTILFSNCNSAQKSALSFLSLKRGDALFRVNASAALSSYEFKVQTDTALAVTKNADFIVKAPEETTEITTLNASRLEVTDLAASREISLLSEFQRVAVAKGPHPLAIENVPREEADALTAEFRLFPERDLFASDTENKPSDETPGASMGPDRESPEGRTSTHSD